MTVRELLEAIVRRWPLVLVGAVCTMGLAMMSVRDTGVYWARSEVAFLAPSSKVYPNSLKTTSEDLIITAGAVAKSITGPDRVTKYSSPDVNLVGIGVDEGWSIRLPDTGGQWASDYSTQSLVVEVVGPDEAAVREQHAELRAEIAAELDRRQREAGVDRVNDITVDDGDESTVLYHVGGSRPRAFAMTALLGAGATFALVVLLEHRARRRRAVDDGSRSAASIERTSAVHVAGSSLGGPSTRR